MSSKSTLGVVALLGLRLLAACAGLSKTADIPMANLPNRAGVHQPGSAVPNAKVDWPTWGYDNQRTGFNPNETTLTSKTASRLVEKWVFPLGDPIANTQPIFAHAVGVSGAVQTDLVYVGDEAADLYAVRADNGRLVWSRKLGMGTACGNGNKSTGITSTPVLDRAANRIYAIDGLGTLWALDLANGEQSPAFPPVKIFQDPAENHTWSGLLLSADARTLYFPTASHCDRGTYFGSINAVDTAAQSTVSFSTVADQSTEWGNGVWSWGGEVVDPDTGNLYAAVGNSFGARGEDAPNSDSVIELNSALGYLADEQPEPISQHQERDWDVGSTPIAYDDHGTCIAFSRKDGNFFSVDRQALRNFTYATKITLSSTPGEMMAGAAYSPIAHALYVAVPNGLMQLKVGPGCTLTKGWQTQINARQSAAVPVVAGDVVYAAGNSTMYAVSAANGKVLWTSGSTIGGTIAATPTVVDGQLFALSWDGHLYAFGLK